MVYKEKRKDARSQSKHNYICVQNQLHVSAIYSRHQDEHETVGRKNYNTIQ